MEILRSLRGQIERLLLPPGKKPESVWLEAHHAYRLAKAIAEPKRGKRAALNRQYDWYFFEDAAEPLRHIQNWEAALKNGSGV